MDVNQAQTLISYLSQLVLQTKRIADALESIKNAKQSEVMKADRGFPAPSR